ncbi:zinc-binding dehydrogenase [Saccharothrix obliqua]|uniref:zinc-binding dehydrogenase n=1 Tax=Saccharothrix obliqua TaxID=2861747 RepID=UPI001C5DC4A8|nr:zinc-binding dehydrogenase [Saccharothrix obliqua]MBW4717162.1 zinc-binding dehydrogenase [Saccharothrix obliqua]
MKAVAVKAFGGPDGLAVVDLPDPAPGAGEVLVDTEAIGVDGGDALIRKGALAEFGFAVGYVPGGEVAGVVSAVGDGVDASWLGRRVWAFTGLGGGYATRVAVPTTAVVPLPAGLSAVDAVTLGNPGTVGHFALRHARFTPGESVLVRGAAGGLGTVAVQLAVLAGAAAVAVTSSSAERGDRLRELGATHVLDRVGGGGGPAGYDVIVDVVAGGDLPLFFDKLNPNGRLVAVGLVGGHPPADFGTAVFAAFQRSLSFATFSANTVPEADRRAVTADQFAAADRGELRAVVHEVLPLAEAAAAHRELDAGRVFGRLVLTA